MFDVRSYALIEDTTNSVSGVKFLQALSVLAPLRETNDGLFSILIPYQRGGLAELSQVPL